MLSRHSIRCLMAIVLVCLSQACTRRDETTGQSNAVNDSTGVKAKGVLFAQDLKNNVQSVRFGTYKPTDEDILLVAKYGTLKEFHAEAPAVTEKGIIAIAAMKKLQIVNLSGSAVTAKSIEALSGLPDLRQLDLTHAESIDDKSIVALKEHPKLEAIDLSFTSLSDDSLSTILSIPNLKSVGLVGTKITDKGLAKLAAAAYLTRIAVGSELITDEGVSLLSPNSKLSQLEIVGTRITDSSMHVLATLSKLEMLRLPQNAALTDLGICELGALPALTNLDVSGTGFTGSGCGEAGFHALLGLEANRSKVTDSTLMDFSRIERLASLKINGTDVTEAGVRNIFPLNDPTAVAFGPDEK